VGLREVLSRLGGVFYCRNYDTQFCTVNRLTANCFAFPLPSGPASAAVACRMELVLAHERDPCVDCPFFPHCRSPSAASSVESSFPPSLLFSTCRGSGTFCGPFPAGTSRGCRGRKRNRMARMASHGRCVKPLPVSAAADTNSLRCCRAASLGGSRRRDVYRSADDAIMPVINLSQPIDHGGCTVRFTLLLPPKDNCGHLG
jgi:hypothetical protein